MTWGRTAALIGRLTQGLLGTRLARVNIYVDDPILVIGGSKAQRDRMMAITILAWLGLGFNLSIQKGKRGSTVQWVSATYAIWPDRSGITISLKEEIETEVRELTETIMSSNVVSFKELRSYAGKVSHIAGVLMTWRPFLQEIWGALACKDSNAPHNCVWVKQCLSSLKWFSAFFQGTSGATSRSYPLYVHIGEGDRIEINLDASPWGLGGYLEVNGKITAYFISEVSKDEAVLLKQNI